MFFHQLDMQINLIPIVLQAIELYISLLYRNQNLPHEIHVSFHPSPLFMNDNTVSFGSALYQSLWRMQRHGWHRHGAPA